VHYGFGAPLLSESYNEIVTIPARAVEELLRRPFLIVAAPALAGIVLAETLPHIAFLVAAVAALAGLTLLLFRRRIGLGIAAWAFLGLAAGLARAEWSRLRPEHDVSRLTEEVPVRVRGEALEAPRLFVTLSDVAERHATPSGSFPLEVGSMEIDGKPGPWTGRVRVQFYEKDISLTGGEEILVTGKIRPLKSPTNPGVFDRAATLRRQGLGAVLILSGPVTILRPAPALRVRTLLHRARASLRGLLGRHAPPEVSAFQAALLFGSREELPERATLALQRSGTAHFLAVSGFNLVIVLTIFWFLLQILGLRGPPMDLALLALLFLYTALTGWQVSVVRAFLMSAAILAANLAWRRSNVINSLSLAALVLVLADPNQVFDTGFQLSFAAVLGIVAIGPIFHSFLAPEPAESRRPFLSWLGRQTRAALAVSIGAWLATAPIVLATFNLITPVILIANLLLYPLITLQTFLGLATLPLAAAIPPLASLLGFISTGVFEATVACAELLTRIPGAYFFTPEMPAIAVAAYYAGLALWVAWTRTRPARWKPWLCALFATGLTVPTLFHSEPPHATFGMIDVGRGSCTYLRTPAEGTTVFDCGSLSYRDAGATVAAPVLWSLGVTRVHTLVLSHADADHANGARSLIERMRVARLVVPPGFDHPVLEFARNRGLEIVTAWSERPAPGLDILGPPPPERQEGTWPVNETSLVVQARTPHGKVLIPGDIEERGTRALLESGADLRAEVLVAPHHGKGQGLHRELLGAVAPRILLVSAPEGYAAREVLDHARSKCSVYLTGEAGWMEVELGPGPPIVRRFDKP
jgi:competence protein ComEC